MSETEEAIVLANKVLNRPNADPDDDLAVLARQFLRGREREVERTRLRFALCKARRDLKDADLGEGLEFNMREIARDLDAALSEEPPHAR